MTSNEIRQKFLNFFKSKGHEIAPSSSLIPSDPSVLFTTAGMQQMKPYYTGEKSPWGDKVTSVQKCLRTNDIDEVGDDTHLTFFEMLGNFAFNNAVSKREAISWAYEFITKELGLSISYVTYFQGDKAMEIPEDSDSKEIWQSIDPTLKIVAQGKEDVFWGPTGDEGPCGPTTEIYINGVEIWNIVFNEYFKDKSGNYSKLPNFGIDTGMGLERLLVQVQGKKNVFETDLFEDVIENILRMAADSSRSVIEIKQNYVVNSRIISDHIRASIFLISDGVSISATGQGSILKKLLKRAFLSSLYLGLPKESIIAIIDLIIDKFKNSYLELGHEREKTKEMISKEFHLLNGNMPLWDKFINKLVYDLEKDGFTPLQVREKTDRVFISNPVITEKNYESIFKMITSMGVPREFIENRLEGLGYIFDEDKFSKYIKEHQVVSRVGSQQKFKGGLANHNEKTVKLHTAHHLLLAALQEVLGPQVKQRGSNITEERLRIDFSFDRKMTDEEKLHVENIVNDMIGRDLKVVHREMSKDDAQKIGAEMEFGAKYGDKVSVYFIEDDNGKVFSKEFCGGPHVEHIGFLGKFKILKEEASSLGVRRIKATFE